MVRFDLIFLVLSGHVWSCLGLAWFAFCCVVVSFLVLSCYILCCVLSCCAVRAVLRVVSGCALLSHVVSAV